MLLLNEIGSRLKEARLAKKMSMEELQEVTKIQKRYLEAIEDGNFEMMPGAFYVRAFIKQYAEAVSLNPEELLANYKLDVPQTSSEEVTHSIQSTPSRRKISRSSSSNKLVEVMPKLIVALFIVVLFVTFWIFLQKKLGNDKAVEEEATPTVEYVEKEPVKGQGEEKAPAEEVKDEEKTEEPAKEQPAEEQPKETAQTIAAGEVQADGVTTVYKVAGADQMSLRIEAAGLTWIGIRNEAAAEQIEARAYNAGEVVEFDATANRFARIRLGDSTQAKVFVNGEEVQFAQNIVTQNIIIQFAE